MYGDDRCFADILKILGFAHPAPNGRPVAAPRVGPAPDSIFSWFR